MNKYYSLIQSVKRYKLNIFSFVVPRSLCIGVKLFPHFAEHNHNIRIFEVGLFKRKSFFSFIAILLREDNISRRIFFRFIGGFGGFGGFGGSQGRRMVKGSNLRVRVNLSLEEVCNGVEKKIKVKRKVLAPGATFSTCSQCNGSGQVTRVTNTILGRMQTSATCPKCAGAGQSLDNKPSGSDSNGMIIKEETVKIPIPAGVVEDMQLKVSGKGNEAPGNGINGDLLVVINELPHKKLQREGDNLHYELYVSIPDAILGSNKEIETVNGKVRIKIEPGMQSGKILRLRGKGVPSINGYGTGDLLVHVNVWTPKTLDKKQKQFFESMQENEHFEPKPENSEKSFFDRVKDMFS